MPPRGREGQKPGTKDLCPVSGNAGVATTPAHPQKSAPGQGIRWILAWLILALLFAVALGERPALLDPPADPDPARPGFNATEGGERRPATTEQGSRDQARNGSCERGPERQNRPQSDPISSMCLPACLNRMLRRLASPSLAFAVQPHSIVEASSAGTAPIRMRSWERMTDLTHPLDPDFPTYGGTSQLEIRPLATLQQDGWNYSEWTVHEHTGTHLDAPLHRSNGLSAELIPARELVGPLAIIDIRERAAADPDTELRVDDVLAWERRYDRLPEGVIIAMNSGWAQHTRSTAFRGPDTSGVLHFPGVSVDTAKFLLEERKVKGLVVDTLSLDHGPSAEFPTHAQWLGGGRWGLECAANLDEVPPAGATLVVGAPKVRGASGGPSRVFAFY